MLSRSQLCSPWFEWQRLPALLVLTLPLAACGFPNYSGFDRPPGQDASLPDGHAPDTSVALDGSADSRLDQSVPDASDARDESQADVLEASTDVVSDADDDVVDASNDSGTDAQDAAEDTAPPRPLLNVWHLATNTEPPTVTMRNPLFPPAGTAQVFFYLGEYRPEGKVKSATLYWQWTDALAVESPVQEQAFTWDSKNGNNDYWIASVNWPAHAVGSFTYYIRVEPEDPSTYSTTYLYGTDQETHKTANVAVAKASAYHPDVRPPTPGELVITEIMVNPVGANEKNREWFEVFSAATVPVTLDSCWIVDSDDTHMTQLSAPWLVLWPKAYSTLGASLSVVDMDGFRPDYDYGTAIPLNNSSKDAVRIYEPDKTTLIDKVDFTTWSASSCCDGNPDGRSMQLDMNEPSAALNDTQSAWCRSTQHYGNGASFGTPNLPTDHCP